VVLAGGDDEEEGHVEHACDPVVVLYVPATHSVHVSAFDPVYPALHTHCVNAVLAGGDVDKSGHVEHTCNPVVALYVPAAHVVHVSAFDPVYPALHTHCS
jgi:hypothetical protein